MEALVQYFIHSPVQITQHGTGSIVVIAQNHPELLFKYYGSIPS